MTNELQELLRQTLEALDSDLAKHIDLLEDVITDDDSYEVSDEAQDMIDSLEEIRGVINA